MRKTNERIREQMARYHSSEPRVKEKATEEIVDDYRKFITHIISKHFSSYIQRYYEDMFSAGLIGLLQALPRYQPEKSMPTTFFASYIIHEIFNFVATFIGQTSPHYASKISKVSKAKAEFEREGNEKPSCIDLAMRTGMKPEIVLKALEIQNSAFTKSFSDETLSKSLAAAPELQPESVLIEKEGQAAIKKAIDNLPGDAREVVWRKLGMGKHTAQTNEQISKAIGIPANSVRYLYSKALELLRESEIYDFYASRFGASLTLINEPVALIPEDSAERMITALLEYDDESGIQDSIAQ